MRQDEGRHRGGLLISTINGQPVHEHFLARFLMDAGFTPAPMGFNMRRILPPVSAAEGNPAPLSGEVQ
jgi:ATP-dependent Lhr-like helicase